MVARYPALISLFCLPLISCLSAANADQPANEWNLPVGEGAFIESMFASSDGRWVVCTSVETRDNTGTWSIWLLDTQSGKTANLADAINADLKDVKVGSARTVVFSGDGKYAAIVFENYGPKPKNYLYLTALDSMKTKRVLEEEGRIFASCGGGIFYASVITDKIGNLILIDPAKNDPEAKKGIYCIVGTADPKGQFLVGCCDKEELGRTASPRDKDSLVTALISPAESKILRTLLPIVETGTQPIISPNGKYIAFLHKPKQGSGDEKKIRIYFAEDEIKWDQIETAGTPLAILDDMRVVTLEKGSDRNQTVKVNVIRGDSTVLAEKAQAAAVGGERLFVTFQDSGGKIKAISLKK